MERINNNKKIKIREKTFILILKNIFFLTILIYGSHLLINKTVDKFLKSLYGEYNQDGTTKWMIVESWMTKTLKGRCAREHSHGAADISGVYYLDTNGNDGNLILCNTNRHLESNVLLTTMISSGDLKMPLETGMIFLWPGQMRHKTLINETDHERVSVSFNIHLSRKGFDKLYS